MFKFITPIILVAISFSVYFTFTRPTLDDISSAREEALAYNEALTNSKALENERDKLTQKFNSLGGENLNRLEKLVPGSVDNIRLVLEIEKLAMPYGMVLKDVKYEVEEPEEKDTRAGAIQNIPRAEDRRDWGVWELGFSVEGTYDSFISFLRDIEDNLRIVEVSKVSFSSNTGATPNVYKFDFKIKTYWLKN